MAQMPAPASGVTVRMYRVGLGDCFLLAFRDHQAKPFYILIDCGIHAQWRGGSDRIREVVSDIEAATGGHIHVIVVTHEHADHISGFYLANETFKRMTIDDVWFAWSENPDDQVARRLERQRSLMLNALRMVPKRLGVDDPISQKVRQLLGFFELPAMPGATPVAGLNVAGEPFGLSSRDALNAVRALVSEPRYLKPKSPPLRLPGVDGVRIFVLGPPETETWLRRARPSSQPGEVYQEPSEEALQLGVHEALSWALMGSSGLPLSAADASQSAFYQPFTGNHRVPAEWVRARADLYAFFHEHYGFSDNADDSWRRIDLDWMEAAASLALQLDAATNNTSLVLAIELQSSQRVLLFPADAQVGNWKSWHEGGWSHQNGLARDETMSAADLLQRTVLYKVGHHGSHNATLRQQGLEMMTSQELTAMIPVDETWALARKPYPWKMPFDPLYAELVRRTGGRILRSDVGRVKPSRPNAAWRAFEKRSHIHDLFVELDVRDD